MKKTLKYFSLLLMVMVLLTGCGDPKKDLEKGLEKLDKAESISFKMDADLSVSAEGTTMAIGLGVNGDFSDKTNAGHMTMNMSMFGMNEEVEMYMAEKDGYMYAYTKEEDQWTYTKTPVTEEDNKEVKFGELLDNAKSVKKVKTDKKGYKRLAVTVSKDKLNEAINENSDVLSEVAGDSKIAIKEDMVIDVYLKGGEIKIIKLDLTDLLKDSIGEEMAGANLKAVFTLEITGLNKTNDLKVPEEVTKNAKEATEIEFDEEETDLDF